MYGNNRISGLCLRALAWAAEIMLHKVPWGPGDVDLYNKTSAGAKQYIKENGGSANLDCLAQPGSRATGARCSTSS